MSRLFRLSLAVMALMLVMVAPAVAHGGQEVGDYTVVFGWQVEPAYAGVFNGPEIYLELAHHDDEATEGEDDHAEGEESHEEEAGFPVDIEVNLTAEVTFGAETTTVVFEQAWEELGHYVADLTPTLPGDYIFHITGTIGDTAVDLTFDSADGEFSSIQPSEDILFPAATSLEARIAALEAKITELETALAALAE